MRKAEMKEVFKNLNDNGDVNGNLLFDIIVNGDIYDIDCVIESEIFAETQDVLDVDSFRFRQIVPYIKKYGLDAVNDMLRKVYYAKEAKRKENKDDGKDC